jgi:tRNA(fMet)-specific endonuclease VapC
MRAELEQAGTPIGANDVLLAGQARRLAARLVSSEVREFERVAGLRREDWAAPKVRKRP